MKFREVFYKMNGGGGIIGIDKEKEGFEFMSREVFCKLYTPSYIMYVIL